MKRLIVSVVHWRSRRPATRTTLPSDASKIHGENLALRRPAATAGMRRKRLGTGTGGAFLTLWLTATALCAQDPAAEAAPATDPPASEGAASATSPYELSGLLEMRYVGRWTEGSHDNDLYGYGEVNLGDPREHMITAHASGLLAWDLDRERNPTEPFFSVDDTYSKDVTGQLYSAYIDVNSVAGNPWRDTLRRVRMGRQALYDTPVTLFLDGASIETMPLTESYDVTLSGFVGVPSYFFESSSDGDITYGGAVKLAPWTAAQFRFDYMHVTDQYLGSTQRDDLFGLRLDQQVASTLFLSAHLNLFSNDPRDLGLNAQWTDPDLDLTVVGRYTAVLANQGFRAINFDYFTPIEGTYFAYDQFEFSAQKELGEHAYLAGGVDFREMRNDSDEGLFNHEFRRYHATPGVADWPWEGFDGSLTFEYWNAGGDDYVTYGGDLEQAVNDEWTVSTGLLYQLFRYDSFTQHERENVYVTYLKLTWDATDDLRLRGMYEYEDGDTEDFSTLMFTARVGF